MARLQVKGWLEFQHYKHRSPPWIKLHKSLLDNRDFQRLQLASMALAPMFWLLASESADGTIDADPAEIAFRLRGNEETIRGALIELIEKGFFIDASNSLATRLQPATPETEKSKRQSREEKPLGEKSTSPEFEAAWKKYPKRAGNNPKADANRAWSARRKEGVTIDAMNAGLDRYIAYCQATDKIGTELVMQAARFFGKSRPFEQEFALPHTEGKQSALERRNDAALEEFLRMPTHAGI